MSARSNIVIWLWASPIFRFGRAEQALGPKDLFFGRAKKRNPGAGWNAGPGVGGGRSPLAGKQSGLLNTKKMRTKNSSLTLPSPGGSGKRTSED